MLNKLSHIPVDLLNEEWKNIVGYEGLYQVSNLGRIKSLDRLTTTNNPYKKNIIKPILSRILCEHITLSGYKTCTLLLNGSPKVHKIHRIIAAAWVPNPQNKPIVHHKDHNKLNNSIDNLEWVTAQENIKYALDAGRVSGWSKGLSFAPKQTVQNDLPNYYFDCIDLKDEIWRSVDGLRLEYKISNYGRVRKINGKIMKPLLTNSGYLQVGLTQYFNNKLRVKYHKIHTLVMLAFSKQPDDKSEIHHIDSNKFNNQLNNLMWVTPKENVEFSFRDGHSQNKSKLTKDQVIFIRKIGYEKSARELSEEYGVSQAAIIDVRKGRSHKYI